MRKIDINKLKIILAMLIWGTMGIFIKTIPLSSLEIAFYRSIIGAIFIIILSIAQREKWNKEDLKEDLKVLIPSGIALGTGWVLLFQGYKNTTISIATLSYYIAPVFIVILSIFLLKEKITRKKILCIIVAIIGLLLVLDVRNIGNIGDNNHVLGIIYSVLAAVFYAIVVILNKFIKKVSGFKVTIVQLLVSTIILMPFTIVNSTRSILSLDILSLVLLLFVGIVHTGIAYLLYFSSVKEIEGQSIAILSYMDPIFALLIAGLFLGEKMTIIQLLGGILILGSAYISESKKG